VASLLKGLKIHDALLIFIPVTAVVYYLQLDIAVFFCACVAIVPLAAFMGKATESLCEHVGEGVGGLINATFGNACELIIGFAALRAGFYDIVKASITGSIIGNMLLVLGASMFIGGLRYETQTFNKTAASVLATLLALAAISLTVPAIFHLASKATYNEDELALGISIILFVTYIASLIFSLKTHKHLYTREVDKETESAIGISGWGKRTSLVILGVCTVLVAILSELLVHRVEITANALHINRLFIGVVLVAIIGNAAEHSTAIMMAMKNKMDLAINIALGSGAQIALFVAPILVFLSYFVGPSHMDLTFSPFEVLSLVVAVIIMSFVALDGECNWLEGVQLLAVYGILCTAFYFA
jgi:Ca2+:H+ antiporter